MPTMLSKCQIDIAISLKNTVLKIGCSGSFYLHSCTVIFLCEATDDGECISKE